MARTIRLPYFYMKGVRGMSNTPTQPDKGKPAQPDKQVVIRHGNLTHK